jgi:hypothetical protein
MDNNTYLIDYGPTHTPQYVIITGHGIPLHKMVAAYSIAKKLLRTWVWIKFNWAIPAQPVPFTNAELKSLSFILLQAKGTQHAMP